MTVEILPLLIQSGGIGTSFILIGYIYKVQKLHKTENKERDLIALQKDDKLLKIISDCSTKMDNYRDSNTALVGQINKLADNYIGLGNVLENNARVIENYTRALERVKGREI